MMVYKKIGDNMVQEMEFPHVSFGVVWTCYWDDDGYVDIKHPLHIEAIDLRKRNGEQSQKFRELFIKMAKMEMAILEANGGHVGRPGEHPEFEELAWNICDAMKRAATEDEHLDEDWETLREIKKGGEAAKANPAANELLSSVCENTLYGRYWLDWK